MTNEEWLCKLYTAVRRLFARKKRTFPPLSVPFSRIFPNPLFYQLSGLKISASAPPNEVK